MQPITNNITLHNIPFVILRKIVLISSYGGDSDSEDGVDKNESNTDVEPTPKKIKEVRNHIPNFQIIYYYECSKH